MGVVTRGTIEEERPDLLKYLVNEEDKYLSCGSGKYIEIKCINCNKIKKMNIKNLTKQGFSCNNIHCSLCKGSREYLYKDNDIINNLKIIKSIYKNKYKRYVVRCIKDNYEFEVTEDSLKRGGGCPVCSNRKIIKGINDISTTHPDSLRYFVNIEDSYKLSHGSHKIVELKCPNCGYIKKMSISTLYQNGLGCNKCSDGISYPEKFITSILEQLNISFNTQYYPKWSNKKKYDFYLKDYNCIIETHGKQHYDDSFGLSRARTLIEEQKNDKLKKELAVKNGVNNYIILDCRKSEKEWIKNSILSSDLPLLLNFSEYNIDWVKCEMLAYKNKLIEVCEYFKQTKKTTTEISYVYNLSRTTILSYLKRGSKLGICDYSPSISFKIRGKNMMGKNHPNAQKIISDNKIFYSITECSKFYNENQSTVSRWLRDEHPMPQKYIDLGLRYYNPEVDGDIEQYEQYIEVIK